MAKHLLDCCHYVLQILWRLGLVLFGFLHLHLHSMTLQCPSCRVLHVTSGGSCQSHLLSASNKPAKAVEEHIAAATTTPQGKAVPAAYTDQG